MAVPCPGTSTSEARGIDISRFGPSPVCSSMMVSARAPSAPPVWSSCRSRFVNPSRLSLPTRRKVVPGCSGGREPSGSASTLLALVHAIVGTATK